MKDERVYLQHMLEAAEKVLQNTAGIKKEAFYLDENLTLACVHLLQIIGEAGRAPVCLFRLVAGTLPPPVTYFLSRSRTDQRFTAMSDGSMSAPL